MTSSSAVDLVLAAEGRLMDPAVRSRPDLVANLLHPEFLEFGASGRTWTRDEVAAVFGLSPVGTATDLRADQLAADVVLVTFRLTGPQASLRSSVWLRDPVRGWVLRFHQGTPQARHA
jgi:hypothetical protein